MMPEFSPTYRDQQTDKRSGMKRPDLSIVIVSYNCANVLDNCLISIPAGAGNLSYEIIIVDNDSRDGTVQLIRDRYPEVSIIANRQNLGFARACNQGLHLARGKFLLLLNPDTIAGIGSIQSTHQYMGANPRIAAASCKVVRPDGTLDPSCKREFPSVWDGFCRTIGLSKVFPKSRLFARYDTFYLDKNTRQEVPLIDACYMMISGKALDEIGFLDERFFMYAEEMDWCRRAHNCGWSIGYEPAGSIVHIKGETTRHSTFRMLYHFHRSMCLYYLKYSRWWNPMTLIVLLGVGCRYIMLTSLNLVRREKRVSG